jgi:hypothetical protein
MERYVMSTKNNNVIIKAWQYQHKECFQTEGYIDASSRSQAQYRHWQKEGVGDTLVDFSKLYRVRRAKAHDWIQGEDNQELLALTQEAQSVFATFAPSYDYIQPLSPQDIQYFDELISARIIIFTQPAVYQLTSLGKCLSALSRPIRAYEKLEQERILDRIRSNNKLTSNEISIAKSFRLESYKDNKNIVDGLLDREVYIYSGEWGCYWRANGNGYTDNTNEAGVYLLSNALERSSHASEEKNIHYFWKENDIIKKIA